MDSMRKQLFLSKIYHVKIYMIYLQKRGVFLMISDLGLRIYNIRTEKGLSALKLSQIAGVGSSTISQIESGRRQTLQGATLEKIAKALDVSIDELMGNKEVSHFETNEVLDILNIIMYSDFLTLDRKKFTKEERLILNTAIMTSIDAIRYDRLRTKFEQQKKRGN